MAKNVFTSSDGGTGDDGLPKNSITPLKPYKMSSPYDGISRGLKGLNPGGVKPKKIGKLSLKAPKLDSFEKSFGSSKIKAKNSFGKTTGSKSF